MIASTTTRRPWHVVVRGQNAYTQHRAHTSHTHTQPDFEIFALSNSMPLHTLQVWCVAAYFASRNIEPTISARTKFQKINSAQTVFLLSSFVCIYSHSMRRVVEPYIYFSFQFHCEKFAQNSRHMDFAYDPIHPLYRPKMHISIVHKLTNTKQTRNRQPVVCASIVLQQYGADRRQCTTKISFTIHCVWDYFDRVYF